MSMPGIIRKLDKAVVNRIAAGEVIQRPANALKELLENSVDAKATTIQVMVKDGGMKKLMIQDNGSGIRKEDLEIVCERFTTSKLNTFEDLNSISTYGFRGEALASISHVAHLTITTKTLDSKCAFKTLYCDGKPKEKSKPCSGNQGTQILVEDLFYNIVTRRKALNNPSAEHAKIVEVVSMYAIHNPSIGFSLKKFGDSNNDILTTNNSTNVDNIRTIYGPAIAKELLEFESEDTNLGFKCKGFVTNANYSVKKCIFLLFINHRLVKCAALQKAIESIYLTYLPKNTHPFLYISLEIIPKNIDVNVHPTKNEVHFLYEESIVEKISKSIDKRLLSCDSSRTFLNQALLPFPINAKEKPSTVNQSQVYDKNLVRTDSKEQKLDSFLHKEPSRSNSSAVNDCLDEIEPENGDTNLESVLNLNKEIKSKCHKGVLEIIQNHTFVGCVNPENALIQHHTKLFMVNTNKLSEELFYQIMIRDFGNYGIMRLSTPAPLYDLSIMGLDSPESGWTEADGTKDELARKVVSILIENSEMLMAYFSVDISQDGNLKSIPLLLENYIPFLGNMPMWVLRLGTDVEWNEEEPCFKTFCQITASFYALPSDITDQTNNFSEEENSVPSPSWKWTVEHVLFPALKKMLLPPNHFADDTTVLQIANLPDLYKVFERC